MTVHPEPPEQQERPIEADVPDEEGISRADAAERLERDPDEQENREDGTAHERPDQWEDEQWAED